MNLTNRIVAVVVAVFLVCSSMVTVVDVQASGDSDAVVVLVPSKIGGDGWTKTSAWWQRSTMYDRLSSEGLLRGQSVFVVERTDDEAGFDADVQSMMMLLRTASIIGRDKPIDVIAHGEGTLVAIAALAEWGGQVRNLIVVAAPFTGATQVHRTRLAHERETYLNGARWSTDRVVERAVEVFEPLYHQYVMSALLSSTSSLQEFEDWLADRHPDQYRELFTDGQMERADDILTEAYYDLLALNAARYRYAYGDVEDNYSWLNRLWTTLAGAGEMTVALIGSVLTDIIANTVYRGRETWHSRSGVLSPVHVTEPTAMRMTPMQVELGNDEILANHWLSRLSDVDLPVQRAVSIVVPGNGIVDEGSSYLVRNEDDFALLFTGPGTTSYRGVMNSSRLWELISDFRSDYPEAVMYELDRGHVIDGHTEINAGVCYYAEVRPTDTADSELIVRVQLPSDGKASAWLDIDTGTEVVRHYLSQTAPGELSFQLGGFGTDVESCVLGFRHSEDDTVGIRYRLARTSGRETHFEGPETPPRIVVERSTKRTSLIKPDATYHGRWEWDFGDGNTRTIPGSESADMLLSHRFDCEGEYVVRARSISNAGSLLRELKWNVSIDGSVEQWPYQRSFHARSVSMPGVEVIIDGPNEWITGRPAGFEVTVIPDWPPGLIEQTVTIDPGPQFEVQWPRPATYEIQVGVIIDRTYQFEGETIKVRHTLVETRSVLVHATSLHD